MSWRKLCLGIAVVLATIAPVPAAVEPVINPAGKITNPADTIFNPATHAHNPASDIHTPAANGLPVPPAPQPRATALPPSLAFAKDGQERTSVKPHIPQKRYGFKTARAYQNAAKKAFTKDDYVQFVSITEDALRRIKAGSLTASKETKQKLVRYQTFGYQLLGDTLNYRLP